MVHTVELGIPRSPGSQAWAGDIKRNVRPCRRRQSLSLTRWTPPTGWCDCCGRRIRWILTTVVPDATHHAGARTVGACSPDHLAHLREVFTS